MIEVKNTKKVYSVIKIAALLILLTEVIVGFILPEDDFLPFAEKVLPEAQSFKKVASSPLIYEAEGVSKSGEKGIIGYAVIEKADAYGGPITISTGINMEGKIVETAIVKHNDTPSFIDIVISHDYLKQFTGRSISEPLSINKDIDIVSGATYSSRGIAKAISKGSHSAARSQFGLNVQDEKVPFKFGLKEMSVLLLVILMLVGVVFKYKKLKWITLIGSLVFIGFKYNTPISLANLAALMMGNFPPIRQNFVWYILLIGIPVITFIIGRNVYCFWICPFGALQEVLAKIGGGNFKCCSKEIEAKLSKLKYILVYFALLGAVIFKSPGFAGYEPFATFFGLQGSGIQWFILPVILFSSLFIKRFWCRFFCPGFVINEAVLKARKIAKKLSKSNNNNISKDEIKNEIKC